MGEGEKDGKKGEEIVSSRRTRCRLFLGEFEVGIVEKNITAETMQSNPFQDGSQTLFSQGTRHRRRRKG